MRSLGVFKCFVVALIAVGCGQSPGSFVPYPDAKLGPPTTSASPAAGPFNGEVTVTFTSDRPATIYVSTNGSDPQTEPAGRLSGPSPFEVKLTATTTVKYFASEHGRDEPLKVGTWVRAGGPVGTITGTLYAGDFVVNQEVGLFSNGSLKKLGTPTAPTEYPFSFENVKNGTYRLSGIADRDHDGQLVPVLDFQSDTTTITIDLADPFKASAENVKIYLGASGSGLGTLRGTVTLPKPPAFQNLQISVLSPDALTGGMTDPTALLQQLQSGYRIFTNQTTTSYPYVITNLKPGAYVPVPSLIGFAGGLAVNLIANPLKPINILADEETVANFAFGPVTINGAAIIAAASPSAPAGPLGFGIVAARATSLSDGVQAVLMPVLFTIDPVTKAARGNFSGTAFRANTTVALRVFTNANNANPLTDALTWVVNPFSAQAPHASIATSTVDVTQDVLVP